MQIILDHLSAVIVSGVIIIMLGVFAIRRQEAQVDATRVYSGRINMLSAVEMIERDFNNLGAGVNASDSMIVFFQWDNTLRRLEFRSIVDTLPSAPVERIKYELTETDILPSLADDAADSVQCYEINRYVFDGASYKLSGTSMPTITEFDIALFNADSLDVGAVLDSTRIIDVYLSALSPLGEDQVVQRFRWKTRVQPINLTRKD